ncbi:hypothetical protein ACQVA2_13790 [Citrobacter sp. OP27]
MGFLWNEMGNGVNAVEGWFGGGADEPVVGAPDYAAMENEAFGAGDTAEQGLSAVGEHGALNSSPFLPEWATQALGPLMKSITGVAMRPHAQMRAPMGGGGHGVNANAAANGQVVNEVTQMAGGDPLQGITGFKNLL